MNTYPNNTDELRQIPIVSYLEHQGYRPAKPENSRGEVKFLSPFRSETKPSFSVNVGKNVWHDYGTGEGGSIFDLVMKLWNVDFIKAKEILGKGTYKQMFYRPSDTHYERQRPSPFTDIRASPLTSTYFLDYCKERCIDLDVAKEECHQVDFRLSGHMNSAIGFENDKGGVGVPKSDDEDLYVQGDLHTTETERQHNRLCLRGLLRLPLIPDNDEGGVPSEIRLYDSQQCRHGKQGDTDSERIQVG